MRRLLFKSERKPITHELAAGDFCMALPASGQRAVDEPCKRYLATVVNFSKRQGLCSLMLNLHASYEFMCSRMVRPDEETCNGSFI